jgi:hypothetical protein
MQNPVIVIAAYNRPASLQRLLLSLEEADIPEHVPLVISIDKGGPDEVLKIAREFYWPQGKKQVIMRTAHLGLKEHILSCGDLAIEYGSMILLEDDLFVSPSFYSYVVETALYFKLETEVAGISLYNQHYHYITHFPFFPLADGSDVYFLQYPSSWGQFWKSGQWQAFRGWLKSIDENGLANIPAPEKIKNWGKQSWKRLFALYLLAENKFIVYPRVSYTTNFGDEGTHHKISSTHLQVPLQLGSKPMHYKPFHTALAVYDSFLEILPDRLNRMAPFLQVYEIETDLNGCKPIHGFKSTFVLSCRNSSDPIMSFGCRLKPMELNIVNKTDGSYFFLSKSDNLRDSAFQRLQRSAQMQNYFYIHASLKQLIYFIFTRILKGLRR